MIKLSEVFIVKERILDEADGDDDEDKPGEFKGSNPFDQWRSTGKVTKSSPPTGVGAKKQQTSLPSNEPINRIDKPGFDVKKARASARQASKERGIARSYATLTGDKLKKALQLPKPTIKGEYTGQTYVANPDITFVWDDKQQDWIPKGPELAGGERLKQQAGIVKPPYDGKFVGQQWTTNANVVNKRVAWIDKETGEKKYGVVPSQTKVSLTWDGSQWVPDDVFLRNVQKKGMK